MERAIESGHSFSKDCVERYLKCINLSSTVKIDKPFNRGGKLCQKVKIKV